MVSHEGLEGGFETVVILVQACALVQCSADRSIIAWSVLQLSACVLKMGVVLSFYSSRVDFTLRTCILPRRNSDCCLGLP
jgi:hypothetical protein